MKTKLLHKLAALCMAIIMLVCMIPTVLAAEFSDVSADAWYHDAVDYVSAHSLMSGTGNGRFDPTGTMSRAMLVTVLYRMEGEPAISGSGGFSDVPEDYYTAAVAWAAGNEIVTGMGNGRFEPTTRISREQFAAILYRYAEYKGYDTTASADLSAFPDADQISAYAVDALRWAVGAEVVTGSDGQLAPSGSAVRAQAATMLMRFIESVAAADNGPEMSAAPDIPVESDPPVESEAPAESDEPSQSTGEMRMRITVGDTVLYATLADNETAHAIAEMLPLTLPMMDLYGREMCYRFDDELPANEVQTRNFELGEIIYWPPRHSFVIMYHQDGEQFSMQHVGQLDSGVEIFGQGDVTATFELVD